MTTISPPAQRPVRKRIVQLHRWMGLAAAAFWLIQAVTGMILSFHFEMEDAMLTTAHRPTDLAAIERRLDQMDAAGGDAKVDWIWTTAGLSDRYVVSLTGPDGTARKAYVDGAGDVLRDRAADDYSVLGFLREIHLTLLAGTLGHWILAVTGILLVTNLIFGLIAAWPRRRRWREVVTPVRKAKGTARLYSWHRAIGLWAVVPAIIIVGTGTLFLFEHQIRDAIGADEISLPANAPTAKPVGIAAAIPIAVAAIPGSRFVGTTLPSAEDASYYTWVRAPGELYRGGYGASLVIVDANDGSVRGAYPIGEADAKQRFVNSFYPLHTGESLGTPGRILAMVIGLWLTVTIILGLLLWWRKRPRSAARPAPIGNRPESAL